MNGYKPKQKVCKECEQLSYIWSRGRCKPCSRKSYGAPKPVSDKRKEQLKDYSILRKEFLTEHPLCMAKLVDCMGTASQVHHAAGRTNEKINETKDWLALCSSCHHHVHDSLSAAEARKLGLKK